MSNSLVIQVPQWATVTVSQVLLSNVSATVFSNSSLGASAQSSQFSVSGNDLQLTAKTQNGGAVTPPTSPYTVTDQSSNTYNVIFNVYPAPMSVTPSTANVLYQYRTAGLPIVLQPQNVSGQIIQTLSSGSVTTNNFQTNLSETTFTSNAQFVPSLPPGLSLTLYGQQGIITGPPTATRLTAGTQTYYIKGTGGRQLSQPITISVQNPQIAQTSLTPSNLAVTNNQLVATVNQNVPDQWQALIEPTPVSYSIGALPPGIIASVSGNVLTLSGTPSMYPDDGTVVTPLSVTNLQQSSNTTITFSQNPAVEVFAPTYYSQQSNVPVVGLAASAIPHPSNSNNQVVWSLSSDASLNINSTTGVVSGTFSNNATIGITATVPNLDVSSTAFVNLTALTDQVNFSNGNTPQTLSLQVEQYQDSGSQFFAQASSGQPVSYSVGDGNTALNSFRLQLTSNGQIQGYPLQDGYLPLTLSASTPQGISNVRDISYTIFPNTITFDPSQNFISTPAQFIQGRNVEQDQTISNLTYRAQTSLGTLVTVYSTTNLSGTGLSIQGSQLVGTPVTAFSSNVTVRASRGNTSNTLTELQTVAPDQWILTQPTQTDFVVSTGNSVSQALQSTTWSQSSISEYSLSGSVTGVSVTPAGLLTLNGVSPGGPRSFTLKALTYSGVTLSKNFTLTVNSGTFTSPTSTSALLPVGSSILAATNPLTTLTLSGSLTGFSFDGSNFSNTSGSVQPPQLVKFVSSPSLLWPLRVATTTLSLTASTLDVNWIQQVNIDPITVSGNSPLGGPLFFACPNPPPGIHWNPQQGTFTGAPTELTLGNSFTVWATDGYTTGAVTIAQRTRVPQQLRGFTSPSGQTQQVRQRAIVNGAVHAQNRTAYLPDPLIASEGGQYPQDVQKPDQACIAGVVYQF